MHKDDYSREVKSYVVTFSLIIFLKSDNFGFMFCKSCTDVGLQA